MTMEREETDAPVPGDAPSGVSAGVGPTAGVGPAAEDLLRELAESLRRHVAGRRRAEERLADFAFREGSGPAAGLGPVDWRYFLARSLSEATEPSGHRLLELVRHGPLTLRELAESLAAPESARALESLAAPESARAPDLIADPDLVAAADGAGRLAAAGLVSRDLETGRVSLAPLGSAVLELLDEVVRRAAEPRR